MSHCSESWLDLKTVRFKTSKTNLLLLVETVSKRSRRFRHFAPDGNSKAKRSYRQTLANEDQETGKMRRGDELCWRLWACRPDAKPPASRLQWEHKTARTPTAKKQRRITPRSPLWRWDHRRFTKKWTIFQRSLLFLRICIFLQVIKWHLLIRASLSGDGEVKVKRWRCPSDCPLPSFFLGGSWRPVVCVIWREGAKELAFVLTYSN